MVLLYRTISFFPYHSTLVSLLFAPLLPSNSIYHQRMFVFNCYILHQVIEIFTIHINFKIIHSRGTKHLERMAVALAQTKLRFSLPYKAAKLGPQP